MLEDVYDFLVAFLPGLDPDHILQGYNTRTVLPRTEDFCIISVADEGRTGSNVQTYTDDETTLARLLNATIELDFIGNDMEKQRRRASVVEIVARSLEGYDFFKKRGLYCNYADGPEYLPYVYEDNQYTHRFRVNLHLTKWERVTIPQQTANKVEATRIVNVDTYKTPPEGGA